MLHKYKESQTTSISAFIQEATCTIDCKTQPKQKKQQWVDKKMRKKKRTYLLEKGCCIHWWEVLTGPEATCSPTYGGKSRSRRAWGSRLGVRLAPGCPSRPWWLTNTAQGQNKPLDETRLGQRGVSRGSWDDLIPHGEAQAVDIPEKCQPGKICKLILYG